MTKRQLRNYDQAFKLSAVKLYQTSGRPYQQIANELGVPVATLVGWVYSYQEQVLFLVKVI